MYLIFGGGKHKFLFFLEKLQLRMPLSVGGLPWEFQSLTMSLSGCCANSKKWNWAYLVFILEFGVQFDVV